MTHPTHPTWPDPAVPADSGPTARPRTGGPRVLRGAIATVAAAGLVVGGIAIGRAATPALTDGSGSTSGSAAGSGPAGGGGSTYPSWIPGSGGGSGGTSGGTSGGLPGWGTRGPGTTSAAVATAAEQRGIVTVVSVLSYQSAESAGTGMVLSSDGEILTNNHVIDGATRITVTVETTGRSYAATVVGTDPTDDVAVLRLSGASGLATAEIGSAFEVKGLAVGAAVRGVGNAGGTGTLTVAAGAVTALNRTITARDESGSDAETLHGLIETDAPIIAGDSGGPLYDAAGEIVGMDTAGSTGTAAAGSAYAIPIDTATAIAAEIESGVRNSTIHSGVTGFLGVGVAATSSGGAQVVSVVAGGPAADAGITAGSTITRVGGAAITSAAALQAALAGRAPGGTVRVSWLDRLGASHSATVALAAGPAD